MAWHLLTFVCLSGMLQSMGWTMKVNKDNGTLSFVHSEERTGLNANPHTRYFCSFETPTVIRLSKFFLGQAGECFVPLHRWDSSWPQEGNSHAVQNICRDKKYPKPFITTVTRLPGQQLRFSYTFEGEQQPANQCTLEADIVDLIIRKLHQRGLSFNNLLGAWNPTLDVRSLDQSLLAPRQ